MPPLFRVLYQSSIAINIPDIRTQMLYCGVIIGVIEQLLQPHQNLTPTLQNTACV